MQAKNLRALTIVGAEELDSLYHNTLPPSFYHPRLTSTPHHGMDKIQESIQPLRGELYPPNFTIPSKSQPAEISNPLLQLLLGAR
jgi:hypothetical protein